MNIAKLKKLKKWILADPRRYNQNTWLETGDTQKVLLQKPPCGTVACLAGAACLMEGYIPAGRFLNAVFKPGSKEDIFVADAAQEILGITPGQRGKLFGLAGHGWDTKANKAYLEATTLEGRARAAAMAIDALIKTGRRAEGKKRRKVATR